MFILNPVKQSKFFVDGKPVYDYRTKTHRSTSSIFLKMLQNNKRLEDKYKKTDTVFVDLHLMHPMLKSFNTKIYNENKSIYDSVAVSRFRHEKNCTDWVYTDILQLLGKAHIDKSFYNNCTYTALRSTNLDFDRYFRYDLVCFNDTQNLTGGVDRVKNALISTFLKYFPEKSSFEKPDRFYLLAGQLEQDLELDKNYNNIIVSVVPQPNVSHDVLIVKSLDNLDYNKIKYYL